MIKSVHGRVIFIDFWKPKVPLMGQSNIVFLDIIVYTEQFVIDGEIVNIMK